MRLKSYFAATVNAAMQQARLELGDDAMLLDARTASQEARHLGGHEVVFALPDKNLESTGLGELRAAARNTGERKAPVANPETSTHDLLELRREIHQIREAVSRGVSFARPSADLERNAEFVRLYNMLLAEDVSPDVAENLLTVPPRAGARNSSAAIQHRAAEDLLREQVKKTLRARPEFEFASAKTPSSQRLVVFIGPPGSGKTSALVKIAIQIGLTSRKPLLILSVDNYRVASAEQLRAYASILGVSFQHVESMRGVQSVLEEHRHKHWVFVDTPGCGPREAEVIQELSEVSKLNSEIETHLVLSATTRSADLRVAVQRFAPCSAAKLLFTHLDETGHYGSLLSAAAWSGKPLSFLSFGQRIPEDLEAATSERLMELVLPAGGKTGVRASGESNQAGTAAAGQ